MKTEREREGASADSGAVVVVMLQTQIAKQVGGRGRFGLSRGLE